MKNLFNNSRFVAIICVVALAAIARTVYQQTSGDSVLETGDSESTRGGPMDFEFYGVSTNTESNSTNNTVQREQITWLMTPPRDPFTTTSAMNSVPVLAGAIRQATITRTSNSRNSIEPVKLPVLKAIFHDNHNGKAVVDGQLVEAGDRVSGFDVLKITDKNVVLERYGRQFTLSPIRS